MGVGQPVGVGQLGGWGGEAAWGGGVAWSGRGVGQCGGGRLGSMHGSERVGQDPVGQHGVRVAWHVVCGIIILAICPT